MPAILTRAFERTINKRLVLAIEWLSNEDSCPDQSQVRLLDGWPELYGANTHQAARTLTPTGVTILLSTFNFFTLSILFSILRQVSDFTTRAVFVILP